LNPIPAVRCEDGGRSRKHEARLDACDRRSPGFIGGLMESGQFDAFEGDYPQAPMTPLDRATALVAEAFDKSDRSRGAATWRRRASGISTCPCFCWEV
jgi:hypothetical protein